MSSKLNLCNPFRLLVSSLPVALIVVAGAGCSGVNVAEQRLVSKPNMVFSDSSAFEYSSGFHARLEPGTAGSGGGQATGCTSCK